MNMHSVSNHKWKRYSFQSPFREEEDMNRRQERKSDDKQELCFPIENEKGHHESGGGTTLIS
jgi:hypothetical protein